MFIERNFTHGSFEEFTVDVPTISDPFPATFADVSQSASLADVVARGSGWCSHSNQLLQEQTKDIDFAEESSQTQLSHETPVDDPPVINIMNDIVEEPFSASFVDVLPRAALDDGGVHTSDSGCAGRAGHSRLLFQEEPKGINTACEAIEELFPASFADGSQRADIDEVFHESGSSNAGY